jgi:peptidoglycan L-alanyl-D-glutamate endopeptidase CwlK
MANTLSERSERRLQGVHPALASVVRRALELSSVDFTVVEGLRSLARQKELVAAGASKTLRSRHLTGHAVDLAPIVGGVVRWDWPLFHKLADAMDAAAQELKVPIEWGGRWVSFKDGPHWQLPWKSYP